MSILIRVITWIGRSDYFRGLLGLSLGRIFGHHYAELLYQANDALANSGRTIPESVNDDDKVSIHWYSKEEPTAGVSYRDLNNHLRVGHHTRALDLIAIADCLNSAICKFEPRNGPSFRIVKNVPGLPLYEPGSTLRENSFLSSSRNPRVAFIGEIYIVIYGKTGRDIGPLTIFYAEDEILFPPSTSFLITSNEVLNDGSTLVVMEEAS